MDEKEVNPQELSGVEGAIARSPIYKIGLGILGVLLLAFGLLALASGDAIALAPVVLGAGILWNEFLKKK